MFENSLMSWNEVAAQFATSSAESRSAATCTPMFLESTLAYENCFSIASPISEVLRLSFPKAMSPVREPEVTACLTACSIDVAKSSSPKL